jgi:phosphatidylinositol alpha-1,6-mannosyltransferase
MEKVALHIWRALSAVGPVALVGPRGCGEFVPGADLVREIPLKPLWWFLVKAAINSAWLALRHRPGVTIAGSGLTAPIAYCASRLARGRAVVYVHGLDLVVPSRVYQIAWLPFLRRCDLVICNSENTRRLAVERGVVLQRTRVLNPGVSLPRLQDDGDSGGFRGAHGLGDRPFLLSVGRFTRRKGLAEFVEHCLPTIAAAAPQAILVVIGGEAEDALHGGAGGERVRIEAAAAAAGVEGNLRFLGRSTDAVLEAAYREAACHVFPVMDLPGDVEGFGMVALESAAFGLPTVGFAVGGVPDAVREGVTGSLVPAGDYQALSEAVLQYLRQPLDARGRDASRSFAAEHEWPVFESALVAILGIAPVEVERLGK